MTAKEFHVNKHTELAEANPVEEVGELIELPQKTASADEAAAVLPGHLDCLTETFPTDLTDDERDKIYLLLIKNEDLFSRSEFDLGKTDIVEHRIDTGTAKPVRQALRRHPRALLPQIDQYVDELLRHRIVKPLPGSEWVGNLVLVRKKDGHLRYCVDYRGLNHVTEKANYPLPRIDICLESLGGNELFSSLDMRSSYWQVPMAEDDVAKTSFVTRKGIFAFNVLPFGLSNAPSTFQHLVDLAFAGLAWEVCLTYLDDLVVFSRTFDQHVTRLQLVFDRLRAADLKLRANKCRLFQRQISFLGSLVSGRGIEPDPAKVTAVVDWPRLQTLTHVRAFVALAGYYRRHICGFAEIARPLHYLTKKEVPFFWGPEQENAFNRLKQCLVEAPVLVMPRDDGDYILDTDARESRLRFIHVL